MKRIWHISDTHTLHKDLIIPENIDIVICSGDCSNVRDKYQNEQEVRNFMTWFHGLKIKHKVFVAGNHDTSIEAGLVDKLMIESLGIKYLENDFIELDGLKIWGSPITPQFGYWAFMKDRSKLHDLWQTIPVNSDIVVIHGPPKGILDLSYNREGVLEFCGCTALKKRMLIIQPKLCLFGHIHNCDDIMNAGTMTINGCKTIFSNGACITDKKFDKGLSSNGNILEIN